jgi:hypothetical protein
MIEALTNVGVGFVVSLVSQLVIFHLYGIELALLDNIAITLWFTLISIVRSYVLRRAFNKLRVA